MRKFATRDFKDDIASIAKSARQGHRAVVLSRGVPIAVIGPAADLNEEEASAEEISTTQIKTGRRSISGLKARNTDHAGVYLTIRGERVASIRWVPSKARGDALKLDDGSGGIEQSVRVLLDQIEKLIRLLEETQVLKSHYRKVRAIALRLLEDSKSVTKWHLDSYSRGQFTRALEQLQADISATAQ